MFQVEPILWLQSFDSRPLAWLLTGVTLLGYAPAYVLLLLVMAFAARLRPTLAVVGGLLLSMLLTEGFKDGVAFPRPDAVDGRVRLSFGSGPVRLVEHGGGTGFWSLPQEDALLAVRRRERGDFGFPSGHVSAAATFVLCAAAFFRSRRVLAFGGVWVPAMALSRMYLGRHFLGDVLGGLAIGLLSAALALVLFRGMAAEPPDAGRDRRAIVWPALLALVLLLAVPFSALVQPSYVGAVAGLVLSFWALLTTGFPPDGGAPQQRARRVTIAVLVLLAGGAARQALIWSAGHEPGRLTALAAALVVTAAGFAGSVLLCRRLGLYRAAGP